MILPPSNPDQPYEPPFSIVIEHLDRSRDGHFRPATFLKLTAHLRTSGFLAAVPAEELKNLLWVLSFLTANGDCHPTIVQLAHVMHLSQGKVKARMQRLVEWRWQDRSLVMPLRLGNGLEAYALAPGAVPTREADPQQEEEQNRQAPIIAAPRDAVIAYSRQHYARPRAEVEREIEQQMGWDPPPESEPLESEYPKALRPAEVSSLPPSVAETDSVPQTTDASEEWRSLQRQLQSVGLNKEQINDLMKRFDTLRIRRQLMWLPYRKVRNKIGFLIAAIEDDYEAPPTLRRPQQASSSGEEVWTSDSTEIATEPVVKESLQRSTDEGSNSENAAV